MPAVRNPTLEEHHRRRRAIRYKSSLRCGLSTAIPHGAEHIEKVQRTFLAKSKALRWVLKEKRAKKRDIKISILDSYILFLLFRTISPQADNSVCQ